jgi:pyrophosphatase PpaX
LFDLDGTLADSIELILRCYRHTIRTHLGTEPEDSAWLSGLGQPLHVQFGGFARSPGEIRAMVETYVGYQRTIHDQLVRPFPGVTGVLDRLIAAGVRTGIVTSKRREIAVRTLRVCGIESRFDTIVTPADVERPKPDPQPVRVALRALGDPDPRRVLLAGDAPVDILAGRAAGVRTAAALWGPFPRATLEAAQPDFLLEAIEELLALEP